MKSKEITFTKSERRILILLLTLTLGFQYIAYNLSPSLDNRSEITILDNAVLEKKKKKEEQDTPTDIAIRNTKDANASSAKKATIKKPEREQKNVTNTLFEFDPNTIDSLSWLKLGVPSWTIKTIMKYKNKGGSFKNKSDLNKIYGLKKETLKAILPYCKIATKQLKKSNIYASKKSNTTGIININKADTTELKTLKGIGTKLSSRIVKYRENIGGFHSIDQLKEIYGLKPEVIEEIRNRLKVDGVFRKIDINKITKDSLVQHFYFDYKLAKAILNYRHQHGTISSMEEIREIKSIPNPTFEKIKPYLTIKS